MLKVCPTGLPPILLVIVNLLLLLLLIFLVASTPANVTAVQDGPTSVTVTWIPPSPLGDTTGYMISFTGVGSSGSVDVHDGSTKVYLPTSLVTDSISVVGLSPHLPSDSVVRKVTLCKQLSSM